MKKNEVKIEEKSIKDSKKKQKEKAVNEMLKGIKKTLNGLFKEIATLENKEDYIERISEVIKKSINDLNSVHTEIDVERTWMVLTDEQREYYLKRFSKN